jgi:diguanylate cyclase (GGDEF)-like protein/PAS domain S-box-containing protein
MRNAPTSPGPPLVAALFLGAGALALALVLTSTHSPAALAAAALALAAVLALGRASWRQRERDRRDESWLSRARVALLADGLKAAPPADLGEAVNALARALERRAALHHDAEHRIRAIVDELPARISQFDRDERVVFANRRCGEVYGCDPEALVGRSIREVRGDAAHLRMQPHIRRVLDGERVQFENTMQVDGQTLHFRQEYMPDVAADGSVQGFFSISFDVTDFRRAEAALAASERRMYDIANSLPVLIAYIDTDLRLQFANRTFECWTGIPVQRALGVNVAAIWSTGDADVRVPRLKAALAGEAVSFEALLGGDRHTHITYLPDVRDGRVHGVYALVSDITALKHVEIELDRLTRIDPLTGLPNRRAFDASLGAAIARCDETHAPMALMFLDIDRFKCINDRHGHATGDRVLRHVAERLRDAVPPAHVVARLAGDEFVVVMEGLAGADEAGAVAEAALTSIRRPTPRLCPVSTSIGVVVYDGRGLGASELLACADEALYAAKEAGRDTWRQGCAHGRRDAASPARPDFA